MEFYQSTSGLGSLIGILLPLSTAAVILRFIARTRQKIPYGIDDFVLLPAWMCFVGLSILAIYGMKNGFVAVPVPQDANVYASLLPAFIRVYWAADLLSVFAVGLTRLSAVLFYRRVFNTYNKWDTFGIITSIATVVLVIWMIACALVQGFVCGQHFEEVFDPRALPNCGYMSYLKAVTLSCFLLDVIVLVMPLPKIWLLHAAVQRKLAISIVFLLGAASAGASFVRVLKTYPVFTQGPLDDDDTFLTNTTLLYFILLEAGLCIVAVNLPSVWYIIAGTTPERILKRISSMVSLRSAGSKNQHGSERDSVASRPLPTKRDAYEITVTSEVDIH